MSQKKKKEENLNFENWGISPRGELTEIKRRRRIKRNKNSERKSEKRKLEREREGKKPEF